MIKRIKITGYKSLADVELVLQPLSVLFGPNGAGKSNFLDALQLLSKIAISKTIKAAFDPPYRGYPLESFTFGKQGIIDLLQTERASFAIEVDVELSDHIAEAVNRQIREMKRTIPDDEPINENRSASKKLASVRERNLRYRIEIEILPKSGVLRVTDEYLAALNKDGQPTGKRSPFLSRKGNKLHLRMEGQAHPTYYERFLDHSILSTHLYAPHYPHLVAIRREFESWFFYYFEPRERMRAPNPVREVRHIGLMGEDLASFLNTLQAMEPRQFKAVEKALKVLLPSADGIEVGVNDLGEVDLKLRENGFPMPARLLSEGTLRIIGLLALAGVKDHPSLIGFEEPENGIHPRRIQLVADLLKTRVLQGGTQYIVTTHSPLLPDLIANDSLLVCKKAVDKTTITPFTTWGELGRKQDIDKALEELTPSEKILRGDFDA